MVNYIFENLPVPVKHLCVPNTAQQNTYIITFTKNNLYGKCRWSYCPLKVFRLG